MAGSLKQILYPEFWDWKSGQTEAFPLRIIFWVLISPLKYLCRMNMHMSEVQGHKINLPQMQAVANKLHLLVYLFVFSLHFYLAPTAT